MAIFTTTSNNNYFSSYIDIKAISTPANPNSGIGRVFYNTADSKLYLKKSDGTLIELGGGAGTVTSASNIGTGSGWFKTLSGTDLQFKSLVAGSNQLSITTNTNDLTLDVVEANIKLDDLGTPDDNTDLDANITRHGLLRKLDNSTSNFLRGDGTWATPPSSVSSLSNVISGVATKSGDSVTTVFNIPHGIGSAPVSASVEPSSIDAFGDYTVDFDSTNLIVTYQAAPPTGTNNLVFNWIAVASNVDPLAVSSKGFATKSGDASTTVFTIAHGMGSTPTSAYVMPSSTDALGNYRIDLDSTNITITYQIAPATGTNNLEYYWFAINASGGVVGVGEANTASNVGTGSGVYKQKNIFNLELRSIIGGIGIDATQNANDITIDIDSTIATLTGSQTLTNKTLTAPVISTISNTGTITLPTATTTLVGRDTTDTLTNKTLTTPVISTISNTGTITLPTGTRTLVARDTTDTLTNKTLTSPIISTISNTGTLTLPTSTDTLVGRDTTDTLTNKTLTTPIIASISNSGTITLPTGTRTLVARDTTDTLTNKTLTSPIISTISNTGTITLPTATTTLVGRDTTDTLTNKTITNPLFDSYQDFGRIAAPASPSANQARVYLKQQDTNNDNLYTKVKRNTVFTEVPIYGQENNPIASGRKWGSLNGVVSTPLSNYGITITAGQNQGASTFSSLSSTSGRYFQHTTGTGIGDNCGGHVGALCMRILNPYFAWRGRNTSNSNVRGWFGYTSDGANSPTGDTYADSKSVFMFGWRSTDTNYQIIHNDGSATALYDDTTVALNTTIKTVELIGDDANARFGWAINGGAITWVTTQVPASTTSLGFAWELETTDTTGKVLENQAVYIEHDTK